MIGRILIAILSIIVIKFITRLETVPGLEGVPADYKLIYTYLSFFGIMADFGLFTIAVREMAKAKTEEDQRFLMGNIYGMRALSILIAMALAAMFVFLIPLENYTWPVKVGVAIAAITTVFTMMASTASAILQVHLQMAYPTIALVIGKIIMAVYIISVVLFYDQVPFAFYHLLFAGVLGTLATFLLTHRYAVRRFRFSPQMHVPSWKRIFKEALPYGLAVILSTMYFKIDVLMISIFRGKQEIAIYGFPSSFVEILAIFPLYFMNNVMPSLSKAYEENKELMKKIASLALSFLTLLTFPMVIGGVILARPLMAFVMNEAFLTGNVEGYYGADLAFQLVIMGTLFSFLNTLFSYVIIASGNQKKLLLINLCGVIFNVLTNLIAIPYYGFIGAGVTTIFSELIIITLTIRESRKFVKFPIDTVLISKILLASIIMGFFIFFAQDKIPVLPLIGIGALVFIVTLIPLRVLDSEFLKIPKA